MTFLMGKCKFLCAIALFLFASKNGVAQTVQQYVSNAQTIQQRAPREILYLHFDKPSYIIGDTIWFSAYLLDAHNHAPVLLSGIAYIELISPLGGIDKRLAIHMAYGHGFAQIPLSENLQPGTYGIRAYTRWMENFPDSLFFYKAIPVAGGERNWLMNITSFHQEQTANKDTANMQFSLTDQNGKIARHKTVTINIASDNGKTLLSKELMTKQDGGLNIDFSIDNNKKNNSVLLNILDRNKVLRFSYPIHFDHTGNKADIQFLPESGHLIAGVKNKVAFKAIGGNGMGIDIQGIIKSSRGGTVASFASLHRGMGAFSFVPQPGETYYAELNNRDTIHLPAVENLGTLLRVDALSEKDSIIVSLCTTKDLTGQEYLFFAKYKGLILYGGKIDLNDSVTRIALSKNIFPTGINSVDLIKLNGQLLNTRHFFINHHDNLKIAVQQPVNSILTRDSVPVTIKVTDQNDRPVSGIFSLAVTDNNQVKKNIAIDGNILSYALLSSDLKGTIETPGYYFSDTSIECQKAMDNLMLTQGFVRYDWDTARMTILAEPEFEVSGKATNFFGKPLKKGDITLLGEGRQTIVKDTITDNNGRFVFNNIPLFDTSAFLIQARTKKDKSFGVSIQLKTYSFPIPKSNINLYSAPANVNIDTPLQNRIAQFGKYNIRKYGKGRLQDVVVTAKARIDGSENLNGPGQYDEAITTEDLQQMGDSTLLQILESKLKHFYIGNCAASRNPGKLYMLNGNKVRFIFDGIKLDFYYRDHAKDETGSIDPYYQFVTDFLENYTAKDIKGIEVMESSKYTAAYLSKYLDMKEYANYNRAMDCGYTFIEITTYGKVGPFLKHNATIDTYRPQPFSYGRAFYQPKYINRQPQDSLPDVRSTIYWNPQIITDKNGEAELHFYSASLPTDYLFWLEGMDLSGHLGVTAKEIKVEDE